MGGVETFSYASRIQDPPVYNWKPVFGDKLLGVVVGVWGSKEFQTKMIGQCVFGSHNGRIVTEYLVVNNLEPQKPFLCYFEVNLSPETGGQL